MTSLIWCIKRKYAELIRMLNVTCLEKLLFEPVPVWTCPLVLLQWVNYLGISLLALPLNSMPRRMLLRTIESASGISSSSDHGMLIKQSSQLLMDFASGSDVSDSALRKFLNVHIGVYRKPISDSSLYLFRSFYCMLDITPDIVLNWIILPMAQWMPLTIY